MVESPVGVNHSAGIIDMKDWINPLHGYHYDSMNKDALLTQFGNYKVLVVPDDPELPYSTAIQRIDQLRSQGVEVIEKPYTGTVFNTIVPDAVLPEGIAFTHRTGDDFDIYFLSNQTDKEQTFTPVFRQKKESALLYNPVNDQWTAYNDTISLPPYGDRDRKSVV